MTQRQRESAVNFLYDLAKGIALLTVVSPWVRGQESWITLLFGAVGTIGLFLWAYWLEGDLKDSWFAQISCVFVNLITQYLVVFALHVRF